MYNHPLPITQHYVPHAFFNFTVYSPTCVTSYIIHVNFNFTFYWQSKFTVLQSGLWYNIMKTCDTHVNGHF